MNEVNYAELIKRIRETLIITQTELAEMLGVTFASVNRWENGHHEPTIKQKRNIRDFCKKHKVRVEGENK